MKKYLLLFLFAISLLANLFLWAKLSSINTLSTVDPAAEYPLLSRRTFTPSHSDLITNFLPLRQELDHITEPYKDHFAFYFEYLPTGTSIGLNEDSEFTAASLLKVPVAMAYLYKKERLGITEDPEVTITQEYINTAYGDLYKRGVGATITVSDAIKLSLQKSDNTANLIIASQMTQDDFRHVYEGLDIPLMTSDNNPILTAQQYTSILKALYFASVLNPKDSQDILDLLTHTDFRDMLPAGVPNDIAVAHKVGLINEQIYQDCGIVYVTDRPYALCMISQSDEATAKKRMQQISEKVYSYVSRAKAREE